MMGATLDRCLPGCCSMLANEVYVLLNLNVFAGKFVCFGATDDFEKIFVIVISKNNIRKSHYNWFDYLRNALS